MLLRPALHLLHILLWIGAMWMAIDAVIGMFDFLATSNIEYEGQRRDLAKLTLLVAIFAGFSTTLFFWIGTLRTYMVRKQMFSKSGNRLLVD